MIVVVEQPAVIALFDVWHCLALFDSPGDCTQ